MRDKIFRIVKIAVIALAMLFLSWLFIFSGLKEMLLLDKTSKSDIKDNKYILNILADDFEEYLRQKRIQLEIETKTLLDEKFIVKTAEDKKRIEARLKEIENEKKNIDIDMDKNNEIKKKLENEFMLLKEKEDKAVKDISLLNEKYLNMANNKKNKDAYWTEYVHDLKTIFVSYDNGKKDIIEEKFKNDNGRQFIIEEFNNLYGIISKSETDKNKKDKVKDNKS